MYNRQQPVTDSIDLRAVKPFLHRSRHKVDIYLIGALILQCTLAPPAKTRKSTVASDHHDKQTHRTDYSTWTTKIFGDYNNCNACDFIDQHGT